jgi:hypothetical protein
VACRLDVLVDVESARQMVYGRAGSMFWLMWKMLSGSYRLLI